MLALRKMKGCLSLGQQRRKVVKIENRLRDKDGLMKE